MREGSRALGALGFRDLLQKQGLMGLLVAKRAPHVSLSGVLGRVGGVGGRRGTLNPKP